MSYPRIAAYAAQRSSGFPLLNADGTLNKSHVTSLARYPVVTLDVNMALLHPEVVAELRYAGSRDLKVLGYHTLTHWWLPQDFVPRTGDTSFNAKWHLALQATGGFIPNAPTGYEVDWERMTTTNALIELLVRATLTGLFDGLFLDYCSPFASWAGVGNRDTDHSRFVRMCDLVDELRAARKGVLLYGNGTGAEAIPLDGVMQEGFPGQLTSMETALLTLRPGDWLKAEGTGMGDARVARLVTAAACMTGATACYGTDHRVATPYEGLWWFDHYAVEPVSGMLGGAPDSTGQFVGWLGEPVAAAAKLTANVWGREFDNGMVLLNTSTAAETVLLGRPWWRGIGVDVQAQTRVSVPALDAVFLLSTRQSCEEA